MYGTTFAGGDRAGCFGYGCGVVFKLDKHGNETVLYAFLGGPDAEGPSVGLVRDKSGNLYGVTYRGGASGWGTVFKVDPKGRETVLYSFTNGTDGGQPDGALMRDGAGNLYGVASTGGDQSACPAGAYKGCGVVFKVDTGGHETVLYKFTGASDQAYPTGGLLRDQAGNLYGETGDDAKGCFYGCGTVFKLDPNSKESVLYVFQYAGGIEPFGGLIIDHAGNLYGTASQGGLPGCPERDGCGTVFRLAP